MASWDEQESRILPEDTLEIQNTQNQLYEPPPSDATSMENPLFNVLEIQHDSAKTSNVNLPRAYIDGTTPTILVPERGANDVRPFQFSSSTNSITSSFQYKNAAALKIMSTLEQPEHETPPQIEPASTDGVLTEGVDQESESAYSPGSQLEIVFSPEREQSVEKPTTISPKYRAGLSNGSNNSRMRAKRKFVPAELKDEEYWRKRNKNNEAARRSRVTAKEKKRKQDLDTLMTRNTDLKSRYMNVCIQQEKLKCDAILLGIDLSKL